MSHFLVGRVTRSLLLEIFCIDLVLRNPLDAEVNLSKLTIVVRESEPEDASSSKSHLDIEVLEDVTLSPRESRTVAPVLSGCAIDSCCVSGSDYRQVLASDIADLHPRHIRIPLASSYDRIVGLSRPEAPCHTGPEAAADLCSRGVDQSRYSRSCP
jgi:hypothetical protein